MTINLDEMFLRSTSDHHGLFCTSCLLAMMFLPERLTDVGVNSSIAPLLVSQATWWDGLGTFAFASLLVLGCASAWALNWIGLPGNWLAIAGMAAYVWLGPDHGRASMGTPVLVAAFLLGLAGEVVEFFASAAGASRAGASRRATLFSIFGSMGGALAGALIGLPIPVLGPILAAILFGGLGAMGGAIYAEWTDGRPWRETWEIGWAAFLGRTFGTLGKSLFGLMIVILCLAAVCF